jgi:DNA-binding CsgD family transcriptional regulator
MSGHLDSLAELKRVSERLGNKFFLAWYYTCIGWTAVRSGHLESAREALETSLALGKEVGEPATAGLATTMLGEVEMMSGQAADADARLAAFLARAVATGAGMAVPNAVRARATIALGCGDPKGAIRILEASRQSGCLSFGLPMFQGWALVLEGAAHLATNDEQASGAALREAKQVATSVGNLWLDALIVYYLGQLARRQGDLSTAEELQHEALRARARAGLRPGAAQSLEALARLASDHESYAEATRLLGAAAALRQAIGLSRWPAEQADHAEHLAGLRSHLGEPGFATLWAEGAALSLDQAVAYVSRARGERKRPSFGWASLTPTELEVVRLTATGLTNPEIGARLFIARGTVKTHLTHVFGKLGITSRAELAAEATRRDL